ncbi:YIPF6 protein, partial [Polypterus senegalus]
MAEVDESTKPLFAGLSDVSISEDIPVEGEISVPVDSPTQDDEYSTLDEPVKETIRSSTDSKEDGGPQFAEVFVLIWFGSVVITLNSKLLGGTISFFQSLCVLGYCILPLTVAMIICRLVLLGSEGIVSFIIRFIVVIVSFGWSTFGKDLFVLTLTNGYIGT